MEENRDKQLHAFVNGHVQGVGFRYFVYDYAQMKGLTGWVRNKYNGQVELTAEGAFDKLEGLLEHVRHGPGRAMVSDVQLEWSEATGLYERFSLLPTD